MDLEELYVKNSNLAVIRNHAFRHVRGIKTLDLSENKITHIENEAFTEVRFCCKSYRNDDRMNSYYVLKASH
jgi:Leucine-rich repeat (LRR) protein